MLIFCPGLLLLSVLFNGACSQELKDGEDKDISCKLSQAGQTVWWFRLVNNTQLEFIASFSSTGDLKLKGLDGKFDYQKMKSSTTLTLKSFNKASDSGSYSCATINSNRLFFGSVTNLRGTPEPKPETKVVPRTTAAPAHITAKTTVSCEQKTQEKKSLSEASMGCQLVILIPLAAGCGVLLILLIVTSVYCNIIQHNCLPLHQVSEPGDARTITRGTPETSQQPTDPCPITPSSSLSDDKPTNIVSSREPWGIIGLIEPVGPQIVHSS
ncbi:hypothetical protein NFI96_012299 [Prochilodus magdalenae]|nr:hypothetical protein NFI96_012299 [Prochilodus magdalenae]